LGQVAHELFVFGGGNVSQVGRFVRETGDCVGQPIRRANSRSRSFAFVELH
jgi:hypothetical protein